MAESETPQVSRVERALAAVERIGNKLPDPAVLFISLLLIVWILSWMLSGISFGVIDPRNGEQLVINMTCWIKLVVILKSNHSFHGCYSVSAICVT